MTTSYQLRTINYLLSTIDYRLSTIDYGLWTMDYQLSNYGLRNFQLSTFSPILQVPMGCKQLSYYREATTTEDTPFVAVHHGEKTKTLKKCFDPYLYELKDHLGNVRTLVSDAKQQHTQDGATTYRPTIVKASTYYPFGMDRTPVVWDEVQYLATLESERQATEQSEFANYDQLDKISTALYNHTPGGSKSIRLTGKTGKSIGLAKTLKVQAGDKITAEVYGKYVTLSKPSPTAIAQNLAADLITAFNLPTTVVDGRSIRDVFRSTFSSGSFFAFAKNKDKVRATLSYLLFDDQYVLKASGFKSLSEAAHETGAGTPHELLSQVIIPEQDGYLYLYLSNESLQTNEVYFDDFEITHELIMEDPQLQAFRYGFGGHERDNEIKGEGNHYAFGDYGYDPRLGIRWNTDPMEKKYPHLSPYSTFEGNPIYFNDVTGEDAGVTIKGNTVTISTIIHIWGSGANQATASLMQKNIMDAWGADQNGNTWQYKDPKTGNTYNVKFDVKVQLYDAKNPTEEPGLFSGRYNPMNTDNFIEVDNNATRSFVELGDEGIWRGKGRNGLPLSKDDSAPHEFGHLIGLTDRYNKGATMKKLWKGNIMAEPAMQGVVEQKNINAILSPIMKEYNDSFTKLANDKLGTEMEFNTKIDEDYPSGENKNTGNNTHNH